MPRLSDQPDPTPFVATRGMATSRENLAKEQGFAYGRHSDIGSGAIPILFLLGISGAIASLAASSFSGSSKTVVFVSVALTLVLTVLWVQKFLIGRLARLGHVSPEETEAKRLDATKAAIETAKARGDFERFGK